MFHYSSRIDNMQKLIYFLNLFSYVLVGAIGTTHAEIQHLDGRIVGGTPTVITNYPYQVSVQYQNNHICGGSIISVNWVLTAAHCSFYTISRYSVRAGTTTRNSGGTVYDVSKVISHAQYNSETLDYDVAVMQIAKSFNFSSSMQAVSLASSDATAGITGFVTGWGTTSEGGSSSIFLQYVMVPIVTRSNCGISYGSSAITARMLCAGYTAGGYDACQGDSGGPLVVNGEQVGIVSWGYGCARPNYPGVYSNVVNLRSWIYNNTNNAFSITPCNFTVLSAVIFSMLIYFNGSHE